MLWDSKLRGGRPDTMKLLREVYKSWNAEGTSLYSLNSPSRPSFSRSRSTEYPNLASDHPVVLKSTVVFITPNYIGNSEMMQVRCPNTLPL